MKTSKKAAQKAALANEAPATTGMEANQEVSPVAEQDVPFAPEAATAGEQGAPKPPAKDSSKKGTSKKGGAPKAKKAAKAARAASKKSASKKASKPAKTAKTAKAAKSATPREGKGAMVLAMIARPKGATLDEIMKATGWQRHTVRGFISIANRKPGVNIESTKTEAGARTYRAK